MAGLGGAGGSSGAGGAATTGHVGGVSRRVGGALRAGGAGGFFVGGRGVLSHARERGGRDVQRDGQAGLRGVAAFQLALRPGDRGRGEQGDAAGVVAADAARAADDVGGRS